MSFTLTMSTSNAAFDDPSELARILRLLAEKVEQGATEGTVRDINGNEVGSFAHEGA